MKCLLLTLCVAAVAIAARADVVTETVEYRQGSTLCEGFLAYDDSLADPRPGVLVIHEWWGLNDYAKKRARDLASLGYVAFAADIYGKGNRASTPAEAGRLAGAFRSDRALLRARANAALDVLRNHGRSDPKRLAAIGYCFGGGAALELARSGADLAGVVSFHGNLDTPNPKDARNIKAAVLVCHGADDPHVTPEQVLAFQQEMRDAGVDWQLISFGGAVHAFTNPAAGSDPSRGAAYNEKADRRSWIAMTAFFKEIFAEVITAASSPDAASEPLGTPAPLTTGPAS